MDKKIFNGLIDSVHWLNKRGYVAAWFSWLEWIGVTAVIFVLARKTESMLLQVVGVVSVALLFFVALAAIETFTDELMPQLKFKQIYIILLTVLITGVGMQLAMSVLMVLLPASIT